MKIGTRVLYPEEVDYWKADLLQISVYRGMDDNMKFMRQCVAAFRKAGKPYVIHPVKYSLLDSDTFHELKEMASMADRALIIHDERTANGGRLDSRAAESFSSALASLCSMTTVSIENAAHSGDAPWFWDSFADSITLDIGHLESFGFNAEDFVSSLEDRFIEKIDFVHMHRNNGVRGGITDHWPLTRDCREVSALRRLLASKSELNVILELNEIEEIEGSLEILKELGDDIPG